MPKAFSEQEKKQINQHLLKAGHEQFAAYGLQRTNVEELARAAGISKGAFYSFYESKEALFMEVVEEAERLFRQEVFAALEEPGPTPRARLVAVLTRAYRLWRTVPVLQFFSQKDYAQLSRKVPAAVFEAHQQADGEFLNELIARCKQTGIPVQVSVEELGALTYALFLTSMHEDDPLPIIVPGTLELLIELVAAYCLGEVSLEAQLPRYEEAKGASETA